MCSGEYLMDMIQKLSITGDFTYVSHAGGSVFNTAVALGRLGVQTGINTGISIDTFGQRLLSEMQASNVSAKYVTYNNRPTTLAFVLASDGQTSYQFYGENSSNAMLQFDDMEPPTDDVELFYCGSISLATEP